MFNASRPKVGIRLLACTSLGAAILLLAGCATVPEAPHAALSEAKIAISTAEKDNASQYAAPDLTEARQRLVMANAAVDSKQMTEADRFARQSRIAAELASARTEAAKAAEVNEELNRDAKALTEEIQRSGEQN